MCFMHRQGSGKCRALSFKIEARNQLIIAVAIPIMGLSGEPHYRASFCYRSRAVLLGDNECDPDDST